MPSRLGPPPPPSSAAVTKTMKANRAKDTGPERTLRRLLREAGFPGYRLNWRKAPGRPDVAYPGRRVAIFVHGDFWHRCPHCDLPLPKSNTEFWARKFALNTERDERKIVALQERGWTVEVVWECELRDRPEEVLLRLQKALA